MEGRENNSICSLRNLPAAAAECHTPGPALTAPHFPIHQSSASHANLMCPAPLMKTATQTCPAASQGCGGTAGVSGVSLSPSHPLTHHHRRRVLMLLTQSIQKDP